jgi:hypothetical protein
MLPLLEVIVESAYEDRPRAADMLEGRAVLLSDAVDDARAREKKIIDSKPRQRWIEAKTLRRESGMCFAYDGALPRAGAVQGYFGTGRAKGFAVTSVLLAIIRSFVKLRGMA